MLRVFCYQQQKNDKAQHNRRIGGFNIGGKTFASHATYPCAHQLNCRHQWEGERHRPQHV
jgi:hypothetical protein